MDWRRPGVVENIFNAYYHLDKCEIVNEENSKFLFANYVHDSKVEIFRL